MTDIVVAPPFDASILAGRVAPSSMQMYRRDFEAYLAFAGADALDASRLARWRTYLAQETSMSPNTINRMLSAVKRLMDAAAEQHFISAEIAESFKRIKGVKTGALKDRLRIRNRVKIEPEAMRTIIASIDTSTLVGLRNKAMLTTLASSGLRIHELTHLKQEQITRSGENYLLHLYAEQGKNQEEDREAHISREAVQAIAQWLAARPIESPYIFTSFGGRGGRFLTKPISTPQTWQIVKDIAEPFIPNVKPHDFRRFVGTQLAKKDIRIAQLALGHKRIETTAKYDLREIEAGATDNLY